MVRQDRGRRRRRAAGTRSGLFAEIADAGALVTDLKSRPGLEGGRVCSLTTVSTIPVEEISYRCRKKQPGDATTETGLRFDEAVPVTTTEVKDPTVEAIPEAVRGRIGEKVMHRLAQQTTEALE